MEWFKIFVILSLVFFVFTTLQYYQLWTRLKKLQIGETLSREFVDEVTKKIKVSLTLFGIACFFYVIVIFIRPF